MKSRINALLSLVLDGGVIVDVGISSCKADSFFAYEDDKQKVLSFKYIRLSLGWSADNAILSGLIVG